MVASHNETSILHAMERMKQLGVAKQGTVFFGQVLLWLFRWILQLSSTFVVVCLSQFFSLLLTQQLMGMCDFVTYTLGKHGYGVQKYVPFGSVLEVMPYLIRRAEENSGLMGAATKERAMLWDAFLTRVLFWRRERTN